MTLDRAYAHCRAIAKREAKNFYYAFVALPAPRRNAICAIYAFMRKADDLADDEIDLARRAPPQHRWLARCVAPGLQAARRPAIRSSSPCATPWRASTFRCPFSMSWLPASLWIWSTQPTGAPDTYATFADLYRYCYLVASVVGLVCIRIFGYTDPRAEKLAEETGIAFQLTNILRDVAEDAARNRVYLPLEDLAAHGVSLDSLLHRAPGSPPTANERALLAAIADRAEEYYKSADEAAAADRPESRPALWVLVSIYHALLKRIVARRLRCILAPRQRADRAEAGNLAAGMARMAVVRLSA